MMMMMANQQRKFNKMPKASAITGRPNNLFANRAGNNGIGNNGNGCPLLALCGLLLLLSAPQCANGLEELMAAEYGGGGANGMGGQLGSIATGSGRIFRPARSGAQQQRQQMQMVAVGELLVPVPMVAEEEEENSNDGQAVVAQLQKRSMSLGRLAFRPGKRRFTPMAGAFAHDPHNHRYEFLFMDDQGLAAAAAAADAVPGNVESAGGGGGLVSATSASTKGLNNMRFRLLPTIVEPIDEEGIAAENNNNSALAEYAMGKRSSLASGRIGFRPAKRSMAVGRTGFRPGKRSIATGRVRFRPGKRAAAAAFPLLFPIQQVEEEEQMVPFITF